MQHSLLVSCMFVGVGAVTIASMDQGAEFTKCITITDFTTKTLADDLTLVDREASGCCPTGSVPGTQWASKYYGSQIVCGFKDDGTVKLSTSSSNGDKTCTYNKCFVMKQDITCKDKTKQLLNGCCGAKPQKNFDDKCLSYDQSFTNAYSEAVNHCTTYNKDYKMTMTSEKTDDIKDNKLQMDKIYAYTMCAGSMVGGGGGDGAAKESTASAATVIAATTAVLTAAIATALAC